MPFDSKLSYADVLRAAAFRAGLRILDGRLLDDHKSAELNRHEPGWAYRHQGVLRLAFGITIIAGFIGFVVLASQRLAVLPVILAAGISALIGLALAKSIRGVAHWEERLDPGLVAVHPRIAESALRLREQLPEVQFHTGELFQDRVMLDPYLVAELGDARLLLGIWDGEKLILCA